MPPTRTQASPAIRVEPITFGSPRFRSIEAGGLLITDAIFPPGERLCAHVHERTCVATTLDGSFDSRMRGRSHWSRASMMLTEPAGERHENVFGQRGATCSWFNRIVFAWISFGRSPAFSTPSIT